jgi:hypothetical protein
MRRRKFTSDDIVPGVSEEKLIRAAREYVASAYPNPDRIGCPARQRLEALARQTSLPDAGDLDHLMTCSACFIEYQAIWKARKQKKAVIIGALVAAGLALVVFCGIIVYRRDPVTPLIAPAKKTVEAQKQILRAVIDLRPFERVRGDSPSHVDSRVSLPVLERDNLLVTIQLPVGSPEGQYVFQLLDSTGSPRVETSGKAAIKDYVTAAEAPFDLRAVSAGRFTLTVRRAIEPESASYAVEVR